MKVLLIPDKFKGSLTAKAVIDTISSGIKRAYPQAEVQSVMASDGGDGFLDAIAENRTCEYRSMATIDALGRKINSVYLLNRTEKTAYIELSQTAGLSLLAEGERNAMDTSTLGAGKQLKDAIDQGTKRIYMGLGGSATNDAGIGIAQVLGYDFLDTHGNLLHPSGRNLSKIQAVRRNEESTDFKGISVYAINDVENPLFGPSGAAFTYAKQKGATEGEIQILDEGLKHLDKIVKRQLGKEVANLPGSGAAGGAAYGLKAFLDAEFISGIEFILDICRVNELLSQEKFDYIVTGEGKLDDQTLNGKLIKGVVDLGKRFDVPVIAICGQSTLNKQEVTDFGLQEVLPLVEDVKNVAYAIENGAVLLEKKIFDFFESQ